MRTPGDRAVRSVALVFALVVGQHLEGVMHLLVKTGPRKLQKRDQLCHLVLLKKMKVAAFAATRCARVKTCHIVDTVVVVRSILNVS